MAEKEPRMAGTKILPIAWPTDVPAAYANNVVAQKDDGMLLLTFFQVNPPYLIAETDDERKKMVEEMESLNALVTAKVAIPLSAVPALLRVVQYHAESSSEKDGATNGNDSV